MEGVLCRLGSNVMRDRGRRQWSVTKAESKVSVGKEMEISKVFVAFKKGTETAHG